MAVLLMAAALLGAGLVVFWIEPLSVLSVIGRFTPNIIYRVRTHRPVVALSFDDGPHPTFTPEVLEILHRHDAKATFFLIGERALRHPEMVSQIKAAGHEVGNHYFRNGPTLGHSDADFVDYLEQTEKAIGVSQTQPVAFRLSRTFLACGARELLAGQWIRVPERLRPRPTKYGLARRKVVLPMERRREIQAQGRVRGWKRGQ